MDFFLNISIRDILDISIVAYILYKAFMLIRETRAEQLLKGILILLIFTQASKFFHFYTMYWILDKIMSYGVLIIFIVFQDELRKGLEHIGRTKFLESGKLASTHLEIVDDIMEAVSMMSQERTGALIIIERETGLNEIASTGVKIDGKVSSGLLMNIFVANTPLHDGAVIIKDDRIKAAGCFLPLSEDYSIKKTLGTRHRAALGISEKSDCLAIVISEETGVISVAEEGRLKRPLTSYEVRKILREVYKPAEDSRKKGFFKWGGKDE